MKDSKNYNFIDAVIAVTYICNSRCTMCNIWQIKDLPIIKPEDMKKLPKSLKDINISGGEPFMRPDLVDMIRAIVEHLPDASIVISSNGFSTALILKRMEEILKIKPDIGVAISLDGMEQKHDEVRRIPQGFQKCLDTIQGLKDLGMTNLRIGFTAGDYNIDELPKVYKLSRELGIEMTLAAVHNSENFFMIDNNKISAADTFKKNFRWLIMEELKTFNPKRWARAYFAYGLLYRVLNNKRVLPSESGKYSFYLDPDGKVFPSTTSNHVMGNIRDVENFDEIMESEVSKQVVADPDKFDNSWMICTARTAIIHHPVQSVFGLAKHIIMPNKSLKA